ncbi:hypothetical protein BG015_001229 [Linnemannia schmuckeri]|uniref:Uncharacterized protein n=1 Tax=Linnemannia schmuckeri TaxID=64567 RepID=A0A9P5V742_9FUNG|nr:hypothetical protein BG015_001229 [Linnemannia schmuckeri]
MIFALPFWASSIAITIIKIILSGTIGAVLTFYVRYCQDSYANSIRWSRIGGLYETTALLKNSCRQVPVWSSIFMGFMIFASLSTLFVSISLGAMISRTEETVDTDPIGRLTGQMLPDNPLYWTGWSVFMARSASVKNTLDLTLNDTRFNPDPQAQTVYTPRTYNYEAACNETGAILTDNATSTRMPFSYPSPQSSCQNIVFTVNAASYIWHPAKASNQLVSPGVHMVVAPMTYFRGFAQLEPSVWGVGRMTCLRAISEPGTFLLDSPKDGLTALPRTDATRCQYGSDESIVMSVTYIAFAVNRLSDFAKVTTTIFDDPTNLPLLQSMNTAINNETFEAFLNPTNSSTLVMLTRISANADFLMCSSIFSNRTSTMGLLCTYALTSMVTVKPQSWDPIITTDLKRNANLFVDTDSLVNVNDLSILHAPLRSNNSSISTVSAAHLLRATTDATEYLASLGHNVVVNKEKEQIYVLFNTVELRDAFEVSTPLLVVLGIVAVVCALVWAFSEKKYTAVFNGSLYKVIYQEIKSRDEMMPMLMHCTHDPLAFEGNQAIPDPDDQSNRSSQEYPMADLGNGSTEPPPMQQIATQQTPALEELITQSPLSASNVLATSTSTISSASPVSPTPSVIIAANFYHTEPAAQSSPSTSPILPSSLPSSPLEHHHNLVHTSSTQVPPLHSTTNYSSQEIPFPST